MKKATSKQAEEPKGSGRPRKYATVEEAVQARKEKNKQYQKKLLEKRRARYSADPTYRQECIVRSRKFYRGTRDNFTPKGFGLHAGGSSAYAENLRVKVGKVVREKPMLTIASMARVIGIMPRVLSGWIEDNKFPRPAHQTEDGARVYTVTEADALAKVLKVRLAGRSAFRKTDTLVVVELHETMAKLSK